MTTLDEVRAGWDAAAVADAMGHILTTGEAWDPEAFFRSGRDEISAVLKRADEHLGSRRELALDFGCGVGRLTVALADHYEQVIGVDISEEMIKRARPHDRVTYRHLPGRLWEASHLYASSFDLVYSMIVLQHMPQEYAQAYIRDFIKLLWPGGLAIFEVPEGPDLVHMTPCLSMWSMSEEYVRQIVEDAGGEILDVEQVSEVPTWRPLRYTARRK